MNDTAIVSLAIGEPYYSNWQKYCTAGWKAYAAKHQMDLIVITEPLDRSPLAAARSPAWQKCLVAGQEFALKYRQIVLLDCDVAINPRLAPNICDQVPAELVGGVIVGSYIHPDLRVVLLTRLTGKQQDYQSGLKPWQEDQNLAYAAYGLSPMDAGIINTGALVVNPAKHRHFFEQVYTGGYSESRCYEQVPLSHALLSAGVFVPIDTRFNNLFYETMLVHYPYLLNKQMPNYNELAKPAVRAQYENNYFLHFAYDASFMQFLVD